MHSTLLQGIRAKPTPSSSPQRAWLREGLKVQELQHRDTKDIREKKRSRFSMWCQGAVGTGAEMSEPRRNGSPLLPQRPSTKSSPKSQFWLSCARTHTCSPQEHAPTGPPLQGVNRCRRPLGAGIQCQTAPSPPPPVHPVDLWVQRKERPRFRPAFIFFLPTRTEMNEKESLGLVSTTSHLGSKAEEE